MIVSKEEAYNQLKDTYDGYELKVIFAYHKDHPIIKDKNGRLRWEQTHQYNEPNIGLPEVPKPNEMSMMYQETLSDIITQEEYMNYNRQIGYSLYGYWEVFVFNDRFDDIQYKKDMRKLNLKILDI
jgi:hypothetical protein